MSLIFHWTDFNDTLPKLHKYLISPSHHGCPLFCTHLDPKNAFWSFLLPPKVSVAYHSLCFPLKGGGGVSDVSHTFGVEFFLLVSRSTLQEIVPPLVPGHILLFHYIDDFLLLVASLSELW